MTDYATPQDIAAVWRPLTSEEQAIVAGVITQASNKLRAKLPRIDTIILDDPFKTALAKDAVVNAVIRRFQNMDGVLEFTLDDYRERRDASVSTGKVYIDDNDLIGLRRRRSGLGTIRLRAGM